MVSYWRYYSCNHSSYGPIRKLTLNKEISIKLKSNSNFEEINNKLKNFIVNKVEKEKQDQTISYFSKTIEDLINKSDDVLSQGGVMKFERSFEINDIKLNVIGDFSPHKSIIQKILSLFK